MDKNVVWKIKEFDIDKAEKIAEATGISVPVAGLLVQRGIDTADRADKFLYGGLKELTDPVSLSGIKDAVIRIERAIHNQEKVIIYGDYDVDGICSTVLMLDCLETLGCRADYYVPDRFSEGYGINEEAIIKLAEEGYNLLISVDCGITSIAEIKMANEAGMDVIITDHHTPGEQLPSAVAVINPKLDGNFDNINLAGVGVAFKLAQELCSNKLPYEKVFEWLDLTALGTVADVVPLLGDNRILVKEGLKRIKNTKRTGLRALLRQTGLDEREIISPWHIGFILAPRLNSAGRLDKAQTSIDLLLSHDEDEAMNSAALLCQLNNERKNIEERICKEAILKIENELNLEEEKILVVAGDDWHHGVIGIVASRICERYHRPAILISWEGDGGRGSGRSIDGIDLYEALYACRDELIQFGGHRMAAGLSIDRRNFDSFRMRINSWAKEKLPRQIFSKNRVVDIELKVEDINDKLLQDLSLLQPYGEGNQSPCFVLRNMEVVSTLLVGKDKEHLKLSLSPGDFDCIAFGRSEYNELPWRQCYQDVITELDYNEYKGEKRIQLRIKEMKPSCWPDNRYLLSDKSNRILEVGEKTLQEIRNNRPVVFIYPTYRTLQKQRLLLESIFRHEIIQELHGKLLPEDRLKAEKYLKADEARVFLFTQAYYNYFCQRCKLSASVEYIVQVLPASIDEADYWSYFKDSEGRFKVEDKNEWQYRSESKSVIYTNRNSTVRKLAEQIPNITVEAGEKDIIKRWALRREFLQSDTGVLLTDGYYAGFKAYFDYFDELVFADIPLSLYEAVLVLDQIAAVDEIESKVLYDQQELDFNRRFLQRHYPDLSTIRSIWAYFKNIRHNPLRESVDKLADSIEKFIGKEFKPFDLLPVLHILTDLGLCQTRKKGSIIEIKFFNNGSSTLDICSSPYYLEGLAEKNAFDRWEHELTKFWRGEKNGTSGNN